MARTAVARHFYQTSLEKLSHTHTKLESPANTHVIHPEGINHNHDSPYFQREIELDIFELDLTLHGTVGYVKYTALRDPGSNLLFVE